MKLSKKPYRGTRDFFPAQKRLQDFVFDIMKSSAESFGYEPYNGPLIEEISLYQAKSGEELINDQVYDFTDRGGRHVAIRPEMTPSVARMVAQIHREVAKPIRWYSLPNLMRYEKPQRGRLREHWQFNCDIFGADQLFGCLEIFQLGIQMMQNFGATEEQFKIHVNDRQLVDSIFHDLLKLTKEQALKLYKIVDRSKKVDKQTLQTMLEEVLKDKNKQSIFMDYLKLDRFDSLLVFAKEHGLEKQIGDLNFLQEKLTHLELAKFTKFDPTIVRGLDYYTGIVFEFFDQNPENRRAICGGGAYDNLLQIFDESPLPGVGFGLGDVTLTDFLQTHKLLDHDFTQPKIDLLINYQHEGASNEAFKIAAQLRRRNLNIEVYMGIAKLKKVFHYAEKKKISNILILHWSQQETIELEFKNLATKKNETISCVNSDEVFNCITKD